MDHADDQAYSVQEFFEEFINIARWDIFPHFGSSLEKLSGVHKMFIRDVFVGKEVPAIF